MKATANSAELPLITGTSPDKTGATSTRRRDSFTFKRLSSAGLGSAAFAAVVYCLLLAARPPEPVPQRFVFDRSALWITTNATHQATGCFRLDLPITGKIANAWIVVAANGGFEVLANGSSCARFFVMRSPRPFQSGLSELGQRLTPSGAS